MTLKRARILVADDQRDVATTLTSELRGTGAALSYVTEGEEALRRVQAGGLDLLLLDMKMPPGDWGGIWVLTKMRERGLTVPVIVLSGEGGQRQTIEAMRLGARDWVDKGTASMELVDRCSDLIAEMRQAALDAAARTLPSPVAHDFARYATASASDRSVADGLRALETTVKFAAAVALADRPDGGARGIPGIHAAQFARPSLGTWVSVARAVVAEGDAAAPAAIWLSALIPERGSARAVQELVTLRNDIAHGGYEATATQSDMLRDVLIDAAHRLSTGWPWHLHVVTSLEFDGTSFEVRTRVCSGTSSAGTSAFVSPSPARNGEIFLVGPEGRSLSLAPWLEVVNVDGNDVIGIYDCAPLAKRGAAADTTLQYADPASRSRGLTAQDPEARWSRIQHHFGSS